MKREKEYRQELLEWKWDQIALRVKYKDTPAGFPDEETGKRALLQWKEERALLYKSRRHELESSEIFSEEPFAGREKELQAVREALERQAGPVVLYGIGGIGKSALARAYIRAFGERYDHILYLSFRTTIEELISNDFNVHISNLQYDTGQYESRRRYFLVKYEVLRSIAAGEKLLLVIDDCNVRQDRDMERLFALPCHMLLTSRRNPAIWGACRGIHVREMETEAEWNAFIKCYQPGELSEDEREQFEDYQKKVQGHTLLMQQKLLHPEGEFRGIADFRRDLFRRIPLKKDEKQAMMYLSIMPVQGIPGRLFHTISGIEEKILDHLKECSLIQWTYSRKWQDEMLFLHPIVAQAAREVFQPSAINCRKLIKGFGDYLNGNGNDENCTWGRTWQENQQLEPYVLAFVEAFPRPAPWLAEAMDELVVLLWIQGYVQEAEQYSRMLYASVLEYYGENHQITGQMVLRLGTVYRHKQAYEKSRNWYLRGLSILENCRPFNQFYLLHLVSAYHKVARMLWQEGDLEQARKMIEKTLDILKQFRLPLTKDQEDLILKHDRSLAYILLEKGRILFRCGDIDGADRICQKLFRECAVIIRTKFRINEFMNFYIKILVEKREYDKAEKHAKRNVERAVLYRGRESKDTLSSKRLYADILFLTGKKKEAQIIYGELMGEYPDPLLDVGGGVNR